MFFLYLSSITENDILKPFDDGIQNFDAVDAVPLVVPIFLPYHVIFATLFEVMK